MGEISKHKLQFDAEEIKQVRGKSLEREAMLSKFAAKDLDAVYFSPGLPSQTEYRSNFGRDIDNILNNIFYARASDKTQVHSFYKNDDLTRRYLHVQFVSRIARTIGKILDLNLELIEAIAAGHDIGHTPFGHFGEKVLSGLYMRHGGKSFNHNAHSVRVLKDISKRKNGRGLSLQTLDGILSHNGELLTSKLQPSNLKTFDEFEKKYRLCYTNPESIKKHVPNTLEGCLVRICDVLAYVGKDRQDLYNVKQSAKIGRFADRGLGTNNSEIIAGVSANVVKNSLGKPFIMMEEDVAKALEETKADNYEIIYRDEHVTGQYEKVTKMFEGIFETALKDLKGNTDVSFINRNFLSEKYLAEYRDDIKNGLHSDADLVVDYIAGMTDDYFVDLVEKLGFGTIFYRSYFV